MAITEAFSGTKASLSTTEWSMVNNSSTIATNTAAGCYQAFVDLNALANADVFRFSAYEKVLSGSTQRKFFSQEISNDQGVEDNWVSPSFLLLNGWDFTLIKVSGTDRTIDWSIRKAA